MLSESQISALLNTASRVHSSSKNPGLSLIPFFCQALGEQLGLSYIQLWQIEFGQVFSLWNTRQEGSSFSINDTSLRNIEPGEFQSFSLPEASSDVKECTKSATLTGVVIVDSVRLVVAFVHESKHNVVDDLAQISEILADLRRRELLQKLVETNQNQSRVLGFVSELHLAESNTELMSLFVTDGVIVSGFDRISVATRQGVGGWSVEACTGVNTVSARSDEVQRIRSEIIESEKRNASDHGVFPLSLDGQWATAKHAVFFERGGENASVDDQLSKMLTIQMAMALAYLRERNSGRSKPKRQQRSRFTMTVVSSLLVSCCLLLFVYEAELKIRVYGRAVPLIRQEIFAPDNGVIRVVKVRHGEFVEEGDILFEIHNDDLIILREKTREQLVTSEARLAALQSISKRSGSISPQFNGGLPPSVEQAELAKKIESLNTQILLLDQQVAMLQVTAPFRGQVFRERMQVELLGRPIQQGQYLMQMAAVNGPWELQLRIPENEIRHVTSAQMASPEGLPFTFALETSPEVERLTSIHALAATTDIDAYGELSTLAIGRIKREEIPEVRFGAGVLAKIQCGPHSLMYLFSRRLIDFWARYSPF